MRASLRESAHKQETDSSTKGLVCLPLNQVKDTVDRTEPESLIHEFMTLTRLKIDCIRYDGAADFAKSATFKAFCVNNHIAMEETAAYKHTFNARAEGVVRIVKENMRCFLRRR